MRRVGTVARIAATLFAQFGEDAQRLRLTAMTGMAEDPSLANGKLLSDWDPTPCPTSSSKKHSATGSSPPNRQRGSPRAHGLPIGRDATTWSDSRAGQGRSRHAEAHSRDLRWTRMGPALEDVPSLVEFR